MDVKQKINLKAFIFTLSHSFFIAALSEATEKIDYKSHPGERGRYRHNSLMMNTAQDVTDITCQHTYGLLCPN